MQKKTLLIKQRRTKYPVRQYTRCERCRRLHSVIRKFMLYRICLRELAYEGQISGVKKPSW